MKEKGITTMRILGIIFVFLLMVAFASLINSLNIQPEIKRILWFVEVVILLLFIILVIYE